MSFEFAAPARILFGEGRLREVGSLAAKMGSRALVVDRLTERWLWWEVRGRAIVPIVKRRLDAYADGWSALSGSVAPSQAKCTATRSAVTSRLSTA